MIDCESFGVNIILIVETGLWCKNPLQKTLTEKMY